MTDSAIPGNRRLRPGVWIILALTVAYLLLALGGAVSRANWEFVLYVAVIAPVMALMAVAHLRVNFSTGSLGALGAWGLIHMAGGLVRVPDGWPVSEDGRVLYSLWLIPHTLRYDHMVHAFGFGVTAWLCWEALRAIVASAAGRPTATVRPTLGMLVLVVTAAMGFGALNEVIEFAATMLIPETGVGGYLNTSLDMVANLFGATVAAGLIGLTQSWVEPSSLEGS